MIHLKYKCKVNFVKLPLIWIHLCLKLVFENATAGRNTGCRSVVNCARYQPTPTFPAFLVCVESMTSPAVKTRFTRGRVRELKNGHNSVTVQNRTHVYMNFFHHKGLGNDLLQLCPKVVKHPVFNHSRYTFISMISFKYIACCSSYFSVFNTKFYVRMLFHDEKDKHNLSAGLN